VLATSISAMAPPPATAAPARELGSGGARPWSTMVGRRRSLRPRRITTAGGPVGGSRAGWARRQAVRARRRR